MFKSLKSLFKPSSSSSTPSSSTPSTSTSHPPHTQGYDPPPPATLADSSDSVTPSFSSAFHTGIPGRVMATTSGEQAAALGLVAVGTHDGTLKVFGREGVAETLTRTPSPCPVSGISFAVRDTELLLLAAIGSDLVVWNVASGAHDILHAEAPISALGHALGSHHVFLGSVRGSLSVYDIQRGLFTLYSVDKDALHFPTGSISLVAPSPLSPSTLLLGSDGGAATVLDVITKSVTPLNISSALQSSDSPPSSSDALRVVAGAWAPTHAKDLVLAVTGPGGISALLRYSQKSIAKAAAGGASGVEPLAVYPIHLGRIVSLSWLANPPSRDGSDTGDTLFLLVSPHSPDATTVLVTYRQFYKSHDENPYFGSLSGEFRARSVTEMVPVLDNGAGPPMVLLTGSDLPCSATLLVDVDTEYMELPLPRSLAPSSSSATVSSVSPSEHYASSQLLAAWEATSERGVFPTPQDEWPFSGGSPSPLSPSSDVPILAVGLSSGYVELYEAGTTNGLRQVTSINLSMVCPVMPLAPRIDTLAFCPQSQILIAGCQSGELFVMAHSQDPGDGTHVVMTYGAGHGALVGNPEPSVDELNPQPGFVVRAVFTQQEEDVLDVTASIPMASAVWAHADEDGGGSTAVVAILSTVYVLKISNDASPSTTLEAVIPLSKRSATCIVRGPNSTILIGLSSGEVLVLSPPPASSSEIYADVGSYGQVVDILYDDPSGGGTGLMYVVSEHAIRAYQPDESCVAWGDVVFRRLTRPTTSLLTARIVPHARCMIVVSSNGSIYVLSLGSLHLLSRNEIGAIAQRPLTLQDSSAVFHSALGRDGLAWVFAPSGEIFGLTTLCSEAHGDDVVPRGGPPNFPVVNAEVIRSMAAASRQSHKRKGFFKALLGSSDDGDASQAQSEALESALNPPGEEEKTAAEGIQGDADEVRDIMAENRDKLAERGEILADMGERTENMASDAKAMEASIAEYNREQANKKWWQL